MSANIEALVKKHSRAFSGDVRGLRNALTEQAETHAIELRKYEAIVANLNERIRQLEAERVPAGYLAVKHETLRYLIGMGEDAFSRPEGEGAFWWRSRLTDSTIGGFEAIAAVPQQKEGT